MEIGKYQDYFGRAKYIFILLLRKKIGLTLSLFLHQESGNLHGSTDCIRNSGYDLNSLICPQSDDNFMMLEESKDC